MKQKQKRGGAYLIVSVLKRVKGGTYLIFSVLKRVKGRSLF